MAKVKMATWRPENRSIAIIKKSSGPTFFSKPTTIPSKHWNHCWRARVQMTVVSCMLSANRTGCHGIGDVHNNKTMLAMIGHFRTFPMVLCFSIPKQKMLAMFTLPWKSNFQNGRFCYWIYVLYARNFAITTQSPGIAISLEVCSFSIIIDEQCFFKFVSKHFTEFSRQYCQSKIMMPGIRLFLIFLFTWCL
jgi:hypothetical protein